MTKRLLFALLALFPAAALGASYSAAVLADSPVGYWRLNESSGTTATDSSSGGHNGTIDGSGFTYSVSNTAITNPATTGLQVGNTANKIAVADFAAAQFGTGDFSVEFWIFRSGANNYNCSIGKLQAVSPWAGWWVGQMNTTGVGLWGVHGGTEELKSNTLVSSTWTYYVLGRGGGTCEGFKDGTSFQTSAGCTSNVTRTEGITIFYTSGFDSSNPQCRMSDVAIYNTKLSSSAVTLHFTRATDAGALAPARRLFMSRRPRVSSPPAVLARALPAFVSAYPVGLLLEDARLSFTAGQYDGGPQ